MLAAWGYAELGMTEESLAEIDALGPRHQNRPQVLQLRLHHLMRAHDWSEALRASRRLCRVAPEAGAGYLHAGYCLHQLGKTAEAKELLMHGPVALLKEPIYYYNLGCYEALLGNVRDARENLRISFRMDRTFRELAKKDPDLEALRGDLITEDAEITELEKN